MANEEFNDYPKGRISMGGGDLVDVQEFTHSLTNGGATVATLRNEIAGAVKGKVESTITFKSVIPSTGYERDYHEPWRKFTTVQLRLKTANKTITQVGEITDIGVTSNVDGAIECSVTHKGKPSWS